MLQDRVTIHGHIRRTKQIHFRWSVNQIKNFCFSLGRMDSATFGSGVCCPEMHVRSRPLSLDRKPVEFTTTFSSHKICRRLVRTYLHITKSVWNGFVLHILEFWQRMNPMKCSPTVSRYWWPGLSDNKEIDTVSMMMTCVLSLRHTVVSWTKYWCSMETHSGIYWAFFFYWGSTQVA
jgi:hypothetical protein